MNFIKFAAITTSMLFCAPIYAAVVGSWTGSGYVYDNIAHGFECPEVKMEFEIKKNKIQFEQTGDCVDFSLWLSGELTVKGTDLFDGKSKVGTIQDNLIEFSGYRMGDTSTYDLKASIGAGGDMEFSDSIHYFGGRIDSLEATLKKASRTEP